MSVLYLCETRYNLILRQWDGTDFVAADIFGSILCFSREGNTKEENNVNVVFKGTVQRELRWFKIGINRTAMKICIADKCRLPCPKRHHHERSISILGDCSTF